MTITELKEAFAKVFGTEADATFFSPGRINLIGEHTDYNGGHVFPAAIIQKVSLNSCKKLVTKLKMVLNFTSTVIFQMVLACHHQPH